MYQCSTTTLRRFCRLRSTIWYDMIWHVAAFTEVCFALPWYFLISEDQRLPTQTPRISMLSCLLYIEHNLQWIVFLSIVWCHLSNVSVVLLNICFRRWCHVEHVHRLTAHTTWPKYCSFLLLTSASKRHGGFSSANIDLLVLCSVQLIRIILLYMSISNASSLLLSSALIVHDSHQYVATDQSRVCISLHFNCKFKVGSFQSTHCKHMKQSCAKCASWHL